jgi:hypothetical protein
MVPFLMSGRTRQVHGVWGGMSEQARCLHWNVMNDELIQAQASAARVGVPRLVTACPRLSS